jgi:hypothetical protein
MVNSPDTLPAGPLQSLLRVREIVAEQDPELGRWFGAGVDAFLCGDAPALCLALALRGRGRPLPVRDLARAQRDAALREAWTVFASAALSESTDARGERFARYLRGFETDTLPRLRAGARRPGTPLEHSALDAFTAANGLCKVSLSWDRLRQIVLDSGIEGGV